MKKEDLSTLKINKLTQAQYDKALQEGRINENELYLTPDNVGVNGLPENAEFNSVRVRDESNNTDFGFSCIWEDGIEYETRDGEAFNIYFPEKSGTLATLNDFLIEITYDELKALRDNGNLIVGVQYKIVDYITTTTQENTRSAGNQFDIIVVADSKNTLNENARASLHNGDTYFANSKLNAWKLKYCLDNDKSVFAWADEENGKGVIYRMIDEFENDLPYDFKNIQYKRYEIIELEGFNFSDTYGINLKYGLIKKDGSICPYNATLGDYEWFYTFSGIHKISSSEYTIYDMSTHPKTLSDETIQSMIDDEDPRDSKDNCSKNKIEKLDSIGLFNYSFSTGQYELNDIVFYGIFNDEGYYDGSCVCICHSNIMANSCYYNTFGQDFFNNKVFARFYNNVVCEGGYNNTIFGDFFNNVMGWFNSNNIKQEFSNNIIKNGFRRNVINGYFCNNSIEFYFEENIINGYFDGNIISGEFQLNIIDTFFNYNTIGRYFTRNKVGNGFYYNLLDLPYITYNIFGNNIRYIQLTCDNEPITSHPIKNIKIGNNVQGSSTSNRLNIKVIYNTKYEQEFKVKGSTTKEV